MNVLEFRSSSTYLFVITIQSIPFCRWRCGHKLNETDRSPSPTLSAMRLMTTPLPAHNLACTVKALLRNFIRKFYNFLCRHTQTCSQFRVFNNSKLCQRMSVCSGTSWTQPKEYNRIRQKSRSHAYRLMCEILKYFSIADWQRVANASKDTANIVRKRFSQFNLAGRCWRSQESLVRQAYWNTLQQYWFQHLYASWIIDFSLFLINLCAAAQMRKSTLDI